VSTSSSSASPPSVIIWYISLSRRLTALKPAMNSPSRALRSASYASRSCPARESAKAAARGRLPACKLAGGPARVVRSKLSIYMLPSLRASALLGLRACAAWTRPSMALCECTNLIGSLPELPAAFGSAGARAPGCGPAWRLPGQSGGRGTPFRGAATPRWR
jgi:hypothetical protein